jgi:hypothetical protein
VRKFEYNEAVYQLFIDYRLMIHLRGRSCILFTQALVNAVINLQVP